MKSTDKNAFTLIELLTVIAIIGILAGIIIPTVGSVKTSANKAKTKVQFSQWSNAMTLFKQEYGYYPTIESGNKIQLASFAGALTGRNVDGTRPSSTPAGNTKGLSFYSIADSELDESKTHIVDAFGNIDIAVYIDTDGDGIIGALGATVTAIDDTSISASPDVPTGGIRAGVVFYSAGKGGSSASNLKTNIVTSW
jgi:prepilin-type N-terminal cleavage/methylation domain-containing protein